jgi:serine/threonine-protein kinase
MTPYSPNPFGQPPVVSPSKVTAVGAAILAFLGCLRLLIAGIVAGFPIRGIEIYPLTFARSLAIHYAGPWLSVGLSALTFVIIAVGAALLLARRSIGRWLVVAGATVVLLVTVGSLVHDVSLLADIGWPGQSVVFVLLLPVIFLIFPIATIALALVPSTGRWLRGV